MLDATDRLEKYSRRARTAFDEKVRKRSTGWRFFEFEKQAVYMAGETGGRRDAGGAYLFVGACATVFATATGRRGYGGKTFICRDPEGHLWSIGEHDSWAWNE